MNARRLLGAALAATALLSISFTVTVTSISAQSADAEGPAVDSARIMGGSAHQAWDEFGYYIRRDGNRLHICTTDPGGQPALYTATITTDGVFRNLDVQQGENGDTAVAANDTLHLRFTTANHVDCLSVTLRRADRIRFHLERNGHLINEDHIFLGAGLHNPPGNPFVVAW